MVDRCQVLKSTLRVAPLAAYPPTRQEVQEFRERFDGCRFHFHTATAENDKKKKNFDSDIVSHRGDATAARSVLSRVLLERARKLWVEVENTGGGAVLVAWSGGIDSTAALCALLQAAPVADGCSQNKLQVLLDDSSIAENPTFYKTVILKHKLIIVPRDNVELSTHAVRWKEQHIANILVTGELGDQLFGSDRCATAFATSDDGLDMLALPPEFLPKSNIYKTANQIMIDKGLAAPWEDVVLPALDCLGLTSNGGSNAWKAWIAPQLAQSPVPIYSTFDFVWWLNFCCKWQIVSVRCWHDGGIPLLEQREIYYATSTENMTLNIRHFYDDRDLECWSCMPEFHASKFPDLRDWTTYKEPLKAFIRNFDGNDEYYQSKVKVPSLCFGVPPGPHCYSNRFHGAVFELDDIVDYESIDVKSSSTTNVTKFPSKTEQRIKAKYSPRVLTWGACGMVMPTEMNLAGLLDPTIVSTLNAYPFAGVSNVIRMYPWQNMANSPFDKAPYFAQDDEWQHRKFNSATMVTLIEKCAALLTQDILNGRSFLDLGACLGASSYWALCMGAEKVTAVEVQRSLCNRLEAMMRRAKTDQCWPRRDQQYHVICSDIFEYLTACKDDSHDVLLAAGILNCSSNPLEILKEMARVAKEGMLIEVDHPDIYLGGSLDDPNRYSSVLDAGNRQANSNGVAGFGGVAKGGLKLGVRPLVSRAEGAGLLQVAPQDLSNMADNDKSFKDVAIAPSRAAIESLMQSLGFTVSRVILEECPTTDADGRACAASKQFEALPRRYFLRCLKQDLTTKTISLAPLDKSQHDWSSRPSSLTFGSTSQPAEVVCASSINTEKPNYDPSTKWEFDATIASRFEAEARCHIPDYEAVVGEAITLLDDFLERPRSKIKVVDVGCATGFTLIQLLKRGFDDVHGCDLSKAMLEQATAKMREAGFDSSVSSSRLHLSGSPLDLPASLGSDVDAALVNWTLHFVPDPDHRKQFLQNIAKRMKCGALLVLTEKTTQNVETKAAYYSWKQSMGITLKEIQSKEQRLNGILETLDVQWYLDALHDYGFIRASIFRARYGFVTFIAQLGTKPSNGVVSLLPRQKIQVWNTLAEIHYQTGEDASFSMNGWGTGPESFWSGGIEKGAVYWFVVRGETTLVTGSNKNRRSFILYEGMYFSSPGSVTVTGGSGVIQMVGRHRALFSIGGPVEPATARLAYIDGCTDSLLLSPAIMGAPCLNHLHFPPGVVQSPHTHPSGRSGVVISGCGVCVHGDDHERVPLLSGVAFMIPTNVIHAFETSEGESLDVITFHPDSDFGPSSNNHPMVNRTMVNGIPASKLRSIRTKESEPMSGNAES